MLKNLLMFSLSCICFTVFSSEQNIPSLRDLAWKTIKDHADCYARIPDDYMIILEQSLIDFESVDDDPFAFLQLTHALGAVKQMEQAVRYIALWLYRVSSVGARDVLQQAELTHKIAALPNGLGTKVWDQRNKINDRTGQLDPAPSAARAE